MDARRRELVVQGSRRRTKTTQCSELIDDTCCMAIGQECCAVSKHGYPPRCDITNCGRCPRGSL